MKETKEYYYLPMEDCLERLSECLNIRKVLKAFIISSVDDESAWNSDLMMLLAEYYAIICRYTEIINELILTPPSMDEDSQEETITVNSHKYAILTSYSKLMLVNEIELKNKHRIHLFIQ